MCDIFGGDVPVDSETLLVINFVNLKIKSAQSFRDAYKDMVCVHTFIGVSKDLHLYCVSKKIKANFQEQISLQNSFTI
jgi:hypothetical protein